jgi:hypothetical protein
MSITVETPDGGYTIQVSPDVTTEKIKQKVEDKTGMTVPRQVLKHNGKELPKGKTARDMGIKEGIKLTAEIFKVPVTVRTYDGKNIKIMVDPTQNVAEIKNGLVDESGIPAHNQRLSLDGKELGDGRTAEECRIQGGTVLDLEPKKMQVTVQTPDGKSIPIEIEPSFPIDQIKEIIESKTGLTVPEQKLTKNGKELKKGTARAAGIVDGDTLKVDIFKVPVTVICMDGKQIKLMVNPEQPIKDTKRACEDESGLPVENQRLLKADTELMDEKKAHTYGIVGGDVLNLEPKSMTVTAKTPDGIVHTIDNIRPNDSLDEIKEKIQRVSGLEAPPQLVKLKGNALPNGLRAREKGIIDGSALDVELYKIPITVIPKIGKELRYLC